VLGMVALDVLAAKPQPFTLPWIVAPFFAALSFVDDGDVGPNDGFHSPHAVVRSASAAMTTARRFDNTITDLQQ
jgi:hypothetical protein